MPTLPTLQIVGMNPLGSIGVGIGVLGVGLIIYWTAQAVRAETTDDAQDITEEVSASFSQFVISLASVTITIGDQLIGLGGELVGMIDNPIVLGHLGAGFLGWLGVQGTLGMREYVIAFGAVTVVALLWQATTSRGRGLF